MFRHSAFGHGWQQTSLCPSPSPWHFIYPSYVSSACSPPSLPPRQSLGLPSSLSIPFQSQRSPSPQAHEFKYLYKLSSKFRHIFKSHLDTANLLSPKPEGGCFPFITHSGTQIHSEHPVMAYNVYGIWAIINFCFSLQFLFLQPQLFALFLLSRFLYF